jgi:DNA-binding XRE family transcriptional regulator
MAKLTKADAARQLGISRTTLYKLIEQGKVSPTADGLIDAAELVRVAPLLDVHHERSHTSVDIVDVDADTTTDERRGRPLSEHIGRPQLTDDERQLTSTYLALVDTLRTQLDTMRYELEAARAERQAARDERALLLQMLQEMQHRYDRLLEAPRSVPAPALPGAPPVASAPRGEMRRRIVALLQEYPEGLSPVQTRRLLGVDKDLGPTMKAMARDGLLQRVETGRYVISEGSP